MNQLEPSVPEKPVPTRIAETILRNIERQGRCSILDVKAVGFSLNDIAHYWPEACRLAEHISATHRRISHA